MKNSKKYFYDYEDYEDGDKDAHTMAEEILSDPEIKELKEIIIGCWGESYENSVQSILDELVANKEKILHIESLYVGDMTFEECEVSWIEQGNYSELISELPNLKHLTIKGSNGLSLKNLNHQNLESLEIICGGLPQSVIEEIAESYLPKIKKLNLYFGVENYGFDGDIEDIKKLLQNPHLKNLKYLGLGNSEIQDEIVEVTLNSEMISNLEILDFSNGTLSDKGAQIIIDNIDKLKHLQLLNLHYNFITDEYIEKLKKLPIQINLDEQMENDDEYGNYPMLTE
ncbi:hypothetical protein SAMN05446037_10625 [Anaerovirgula multivorans]|uniref:Leucine Rich repeat-containing protein n=1 Tax=Anaerovirgula multivorans TaxID=312168 RepID=A0A239L3P0_9FIRM|nr:STM4015 family protein [Anaerovirgula multivorans]SNT24955.1 hypothetical protein SAMN05446037_10625 [Anaerovirgula multivorans]